MRSILVRDTTREEREAIIAESVGILDGACDGCAPGILEMYQPYIEGKMELREVNMAFNRGYTKGAMPPPRSDCGVVGMTGDPEEE